MEIFELQDGESVAFHIESAETGDYTIHPAHAPEGKLIRVLRVHVPTTDKAHFPYYYDITGKTAVAQIEPMLANIIQGKRLVKITKRGVAPRARFTVEII
jgi:hypothetical protein